MYPFQEGRSSIGLESYLSMSLIGNWIASISVYKEGKAAFVFCGVQGHSRLILECRYFFCLAVSSFHGKETGLRDGSCIQDNATNPTTVTRPEDIQQPTQSPIQTCDSDSHAHSGGPLNTERKSFAQLLRRTSTSIPNTHGSLDSPTRESSTWKLETLLFKRDDLKTTFGGLIKVFSFR